MQGGLKDGVLDGVGAWATGNCGVMMYQFTGFFARCQMAPPADLPDGAIWRVIERPFVGVGVSLRKLSRHVPATEEVDHYREQIGLPPEADWLFIHYVCWGGRVDFVYGFGVRNGETFGPFEGEDEEIYVALMEAFGVASADATRFAPFVRGFWGE